jgi:glycosyltransferase involved in cell wall biosynthesis
VFLCGLANPSVALPEGWLFINSSISEGLPLAIGEAGLCGLPVVCTDVGGSREVFSDAPPGEPIDPTLTYGRLVPPRSPSDLAVAQLEIMTMTNGMEKIVDKNCNNVVSLEKLKQDPDAMLRRMMDPLIKAKRRHLGLMLRSRVYRVNIMNGHWPRK